MSNETFPVELTVNYEITTEQVEDLLSCAFEGGVGYWCMITDYEIPEGVEVTYKHIELPLRGGAVICVESNDGETEQETPWRVDRDAIERGLRLLALKRPRDFADLVNGNMDADTGDNFLQLALFGELVYG